jgi:hypothetical protein
MKKDEKGEAAEEEYPLTSFDLLEEGEGGT